MIKHRNRFNSIASPTRYAAHLRHVHPDHLAQILSLMRHPRSLARPTANWRPPRLPLPPVSGGDQLTLTLSRMRVGDAARDIILATGENRSPAYLVTIRLSSPEGYRVPRTLAEGWVRALLDDDKINAVHELPDEPTPTFCWLVDSRFIPVPSPASLFQRPARAA